MQTSTGSDKEAMVLHADFLNASDAYHFQVSGDYIYHSFVYTNPINRISDYS